MWGTSAIIGTSQVVRIRWLSSSLHPFSAADVAHGGSRLSKVSQMPHYLAASPRLTLRCTRTSPKPDGRHNVILPANSWFASGSPPCQRHPRGMMMMMMPEQVQLARLHSNIWALYTDPKQSHAIGHWAKLITDTIPYNTIPTFRCCTGLLVKLTPRFISVIHY